MFELLTLFLTGGGSAAMGSILKGVFGMLTDSRQQKYEIEMAREARNNEFAIKFQESLNSGDGGAFTRATRRMLALIGMGTISFVTCITVFRQSKPIWSSLQDTSASSKHQSCCR